MMVENIMLKDNILPILGKTKSRYTFSTGQPVLYVIRYEDFISLVQKLNSGSNLNLTYYTNQQYLDGVKNNASVRLFYDTCLRALLEQMYTSYQEHTMYTSLILPVVSDKNTLSVSLNDWADTMLCDITEEVRDLDNGLTEYTSANVGLPPAFLHQLNSKNSIQALTLALSLYKATWHKHSKYFSIKES